MKKCFHSCNASRTVKTVATLFSMNDDMMGPKQNAYSLIHTIRRLQQLLQRGRLLQIIRNFSIFTAMDCDCCWLQQICSRQYIRSEYVGSSLS